MWVQNLLCLLLRVLDLQNSAATSYARRPETNIRPLLFSSLPLSLPQFTALDPNCEHLAVAGRTGLAHYSIQLRKWRLFGNETQEKDFIVTGGLLWWKEFIIVGCFNLAALVDEVRIYTRTEKLDNAFSKVFKVDSQVLLLNLLKDHLVVFCADNQIGIYKLNGAGTDGKRK